MQKSLLKISAYLSLALLLQTNLSIAQSEGLPVGFSPEELADMNRADYTIPFYSASGITTAPTLPVRNMAQWEETQALTITWTSYQSVLREIVRAARQETQVYIVCGSACTGSTDSTSVKNYLTAGGVPLSNVHYIYTACNSVWTRDYSANPCYLNDVDSLIMVDWKYNRPTRTKDDTVCRALARSLNVPLYETTVNPTQLIHTGGNYMTDGLHTAFSSKLTQTENPTKTVAQIDTIMADFMGIHRYIWMETLPYDGIHHIDMHMKLLNEETLLVGEYPSGVADGPQIEANLSYILANYNSVFGTPYKVVRIPQPPDQNMGFSYPDAGGSYLTYANATIINKSVIVPQFYTEYDTTALRIWRESMPGYNIVGINSNTTITASGSLHCITHAVGVADPLLIVHQNLPNTSNTVTPYQVDARIQHKSGIQYATLYWTTDTTSVPFSAVTMSLTSAPNNTWTGFIPAQPAGTHIFYYIKAHANSGKEQVRPMPAPRGNFEFDVLGTTGVNEVLGGVAFKPAYPNPSHGLTCIPVTCSKDTKGSIKLYDMLGKEIALIFEGDMPAGDKNYFLNSISANMNAGAYLLVIQTSEGRSTQKLMVR